MGDEVAAAILGTPTDHMGSLAMSEDDKIAKMNDLITRWRLPGLVRVQPSQVIPDTTNRENTGLSTVHVHYIACKMESDGFQPRGTPDGHDLPIVVQENCESALGLESLMRWQAALVESKGVLASRLPPYTPPASAAYASDASTAAAALSAASAASSASSTSASSTSSASASSSASSTSSASSPYPPFFTSLGNGHFFQALNLFGARHRCLFAEDGEDRRYRTEQDPLLRVAVERGVECVVLGPGMTHADRKFVSQMLNSAFEYQMVVERGAEGRVVIDRSVRKGKEPTMFEAMTKNADSYELGALVTQHMKLQAERQRKQTEKAAEAAAAAAGGGGAIKKKKARRILGGGNILKSRL